ncbi:SAM-dependent methyltransferase [Uliginosibacterium sp. H1]|uniref:SAM-dependent methyltransferase n=1 Tax=Uliginosibacterium sp. H1 TaxID=3114757 RepID=UPI002E1763B1|nr:class I SAM-dependent methyltransferase [Uliginosibacterium sp. H1]
MSVFRKSLVAAACFVVTSGLAWAQQGGATYEPSVGQPGKDVVWVPTSQTLVDKMLDMAGLTAKDSLVDLGSGDGRMVITAAKRGAKARGIEYNPDMVALSKRLAAAEGMADKVQLELGDIFQSNFSDATVVTLFLLPQLNLRLRPTLLDMKPGTRIVSNSFDMGDWVPDESAVVTEGCSGHCNALKWTVPAKVGGTWKLGDQQLVLTQTYQKIEGSLNSGGKGAFISDTKLTGTNIQFTAAGQRYVGVVDGNTIRGKVNGKDWTATR